MSQAYLLLDRTQIDNLAHRLFEVAPGEREALESLVREKMGHAVDLAVPLDVSVGVGRSWHDAAH